MINPGVLGALWAASRSGQHQQNVLWAYDPQDERPIFSFAVATFLGLVALSGLPGPVRLAATFAALVLFFPWAFTRYCLIPLGYAGAARFLTLWSGIAWLGDRFGGSIAAGAWAMLRRETHDEEWFARQTKQLEKTSLRPGGILACGLAAASRGDREGARLFLASVDDLHDIYSPSLARRMAREWLMVEAVERGDWSAIHEHGTRRGSRTCVSRVLYGVACLRLGRPYRLAKPRLVTWWLLSGAWMPLWPLVTAALVPLPEPEPDVQPEIEKTLRSVLDAHTRLLLMPAPTLERLTAVAAGWDALLAGGSPLADLADRVKATAVDDLAALAKEAELAIGPVTGAGGVLGAVAARVRKERLAELEEVADRLRQRAKAKRPLPPPDEWREYLQLRAVYRKAIALGGAEIRRLAFTSMYNGVTWQSVWLYNERGERPIAHGMFRWMLGEATAAGDQPAIQAQTNNVGLLPERIARLPPGWR